MPLPTILSTAVARRLLILSTAALCACLAQSLHAADLSGRYEGAWKNCHDRHGGTIAVEIERCGPCKYKAKFWGLAAVYGIWPYQYSTTLTVTGVEGYRVHFRGEHWLPPYGYYSICGTVEGCELVARFEKEDGCGYFVMKRVGPCSRKRPTNCKGCCRP